MYSFDFRHTLFFVIINFSQYIIRKMECINILWIIIEKNWNIEVRVCLFQKTCSDLYKKLKLKLEIIKKFRFIRLKFLNFTFGIKNSKLHLETKFKIYIIMNAIYKTINCLLKKSFIILFHLVFYFFYIFFILTPYCCSSWEIMPCGNIYSLSFLS